MEACSPAEIPGKLQNLKIYLSKISFHKRGDIHRKLGTPYTFGNPISPSSFLALAFFMYGIHGMVTSVVLGSNGLGGESAKVS